MSTAVIQQVHSIIIVCFHFIVVVLSCIVIECVASKLLFFVLSCIRKWLLVDLSIEWVPLDIVDLLLICKVLLLLMHLCLILQCFLMQYFIFLLLSCKSFMKFLIILKLIHYLCLRIACTNSCILHLNLVGLALINQPLILIIANLPFFTSL